MTGRQIGHFEIVGKLGEGGMGEVFKARDQRLDRLVAIKVLPAKVVADADRQRRFVQEAKSASALNHPNIVTVYEIDTAGDVPFIAMEYVAGRTLDHVTPRNGMRIGEALQFAIQIADALAAAHAAGIVHRDIKPANLMVTDRGVVKVLDFGLAKLTGRGNATTAAREDGADDTPTVTIGAVESEEGTIAGTIAYMSPEQAEGKKIDARSDIFSFGAVLYEMFTGQRAFAGATKASTMAAILNREPKPASEVLEDFPKELDRVLARCLRKDPERRFQTMADLKVALQELKEESDSGRLAPGPEGGAARKQRRHLLLVAGVCAAVLAAVVGWRALRPDGKPGPALKVVPLTAYSGSEIEPSFSPDGSQVAFAWNGEKRDRYEIYVKLVEGGSVLPLTAGPEPAVAPAWSPNGRYVAFQRPNGIYLISPLGGPERLICAVASDFRTERMLFERGGSRRPKLSWTPDSKSLAFADRPAPAEASQIYLVSLDTGEKRPLTQPPPQSDGDRIPELSPDGTMLAFSRSMNPTSTDVLVVPAAGGSPRRVASGARYVADLAWVPGGEDLIFSSDRAAAWNLWRVAAKAGREREPQLVPGAVGDPRDLAISRAGADSSFRLAYASYTFDLDIWDCELPCEAPRRLIASSRSESSAVYSPNGERIAFASDRSGFYEIWTADADGSNPVQLTSLGTFTGSPQWSPNGLRIAFDGLNAGNRDIYVVPAQGGTARRMTTETSEESRPSFSRDGRWIYFMSDRSGSRQIWKMLAEGGPATEVTKQGGLEPRDSPDGKLLYYITDRYAPGLLSVPVEGGEEVTRIPAALLGGWSVSSHGIYFFDFAAGASGMVPLKLYGFETRNVTGMGNMENPSTTGPGLSISPDERRALFSRANRRESDLFLIENLR